MNTRIGGATGKLKAVERGEKGEPLPYSVCIWVVLSGREDWGTKGSRRGVRVDG